MISLRVNTVRESKLLYVLRLLCNQRKNFNIHCFRLESKLESDVTFSNVKPLQ